MNNTKIELRKRFTYHPPKTTEQILLYQEIRNAGYDFTEVALNNCPESRELSLALTKIEEAVMWANAAIARNS